MHQTFHKRLKTNATGTNLLSFIKCNIQHGLRSSATNLKPGVTQTPIKSTNFCKIGNYIYMMLGISHTSGCRTRTTPKLPESSPSATPLGTTTHKDHQVASVSITLCVVFTNRSQSQATLISINSRI